NISIDFVAILFTISGHKINKIESNDGLCIAIAYISIQQNPILYNLHSRHACRLKIVITTLNTKAHFFRIKHVSMIEILLKEMQFIVTSLGRISISYATEQQDRSITILENPTFNHNPLCEIQNRIKSRFITFFVVV